ncbi:MAG TPA: valine--tRNA ligase [Thermomicrobiales bacterium]|nr:valine--tRNA ligase [Thermomicrobiales bacterium]
MTQHGGLRELGKAYDPAQAEAHWYDFWHSGGYLKPVDRGRGPFVMVMPPPNVTGELHMGHALFTTVEDILTRYKRMNGYAALWLPGADHAGIAGQWVVERELAKEGKTRHDLGRESFVNRVWDWMEAYQERIKGQLRALGASCDWSRYIFTMDPGPAHAVRVAFKHLYDKGLIYRGERMISWCPRCMTALSDLEVVHSQEASFLWTLRYPLSDGSGFIDVATTRPETMLGDTGVAVHPDDERYRDAIGKHVRLPIMDRPIPVVGDDAVDAAFGTGAVKVTPAHDPNDFEIGRRHGLPAIAVMNTDGTMNDEAGPFAGQTILDARANVVDRLREGGTLIATTPHTHSIGRCDRCDSIIEPMISKQWFVNMAPLAKPAIQVVHDGQIRFVPERFTSVYLNWMENVHDWCISRQLWWGHRIPIWYCADCGAVAATSDEFLIACPGCGSRRIEQDPDVLDTWFSSGLWTFSTLGWPEQTEDLRLYYPGHVMETGYDIIFLWVARMIFLGIEFMGVPPFRDVYLHGTVRDANGQRMSKTKGNVLDPLTVTAEYGTDALRFALITASGPGNDLRLSNERVEQQRNFANKLFNATRFALRAIDMAHIGRDSDGAPLQPVASAMSAPDKWIVSRLSHTIVEVTRLTDAYQLHEAGRQLYEFIWSEFCDWYIEAAKVRLYGDSGDSAVPQTLAYVLERTLRLLHPYMPYVTEELWQQLPHPGDALIVAPWPNPGLRYPADEQSFASIMQAIREVRNARTEHGVEPGRKIAAIVYPGQSSSTYAELRSEFQSLARLDPRRYEIRSGEPIATDRAVSIVTGNVSIFLPLADMIDVDAERGRIEREIEQVLGEIERATSMLANQQFVSRAPEAVVAGHRERLESAEERRSLLEKRLGDLG